MIYFFVKIKSFFKNIEEKIQSKLFTDLYSTPKKKLGFMHANLIIGLFYNDKIEVNENFNTVALQIIKKDFDENYGIANTNDIKDDKISKNVADPKKKVCSCCIVF